MKRVTGLVAAPVFSVLAAACSFDFGSLQGGGSDTGVAGTGGGGIGRDAGVSDAPDAQPDVPIAGSVGGAGGISGVGSTGGGTTISRGGATSSSGGTIVSLGGTTGSIGGEISTGGATTTSGGGAVAGGATSTDAGAGDAGNCPNYVIAVVRDFRGWPSTASDPGGAAPKHPDFEPGGGHYVDDRGIVTTTLGSDQKPVYASTGPTLTVTSADTFNQWYRDTAGVNMRFEISLPLTPDPLDPGGLVYNNQHYFPIDNQGWGDQGQTHNYSFTTEIHTSFTYKGGETFTFIGDDDVFVYVNNHQVIDLGGIHNAETGTVNLDDHAASLGLIVGQTYNMDIFHAQRHVTESNFEMETKFECLTPIVIP